MDDIEDIIPQKKEYISQTYYITDEVYNRVYPHLLKLITYLRNNPEEYFCDNNKKLELIRIFIRKEAKFSGGKVELIYYYRKAVKENKIIRDNDFEHWIQSNGMRNESGVLVVTVVMKPDKMSCPMNCSFCPTQPGITKSYLLDEPAVHRGFENQWDPIKQFNARMDMYYSMGITDLSKLEIIIEGGTFGSYDKDYSEEFIRDLYYAANIYLSAELRINRKEKVKQQIHDEIFFNETAECRIIGLTIETRPDWITKAEIIRFRKLGVTRVQLGVQHINDEILDHVKRECKTIDAEKGISLLLNNCFKIDGHFMPDLPGSSYEEDLQMFQYLFSDNNETMQFDQLKIYPCMVVVFTEIKKWYEDGTYKPYAEEEDGRHMANLLKWIITNCPPWIRLNRIIRDFQTKDIIGGTKNTHWRQLVQDELRREGLQMSDIRGREIKGRKYDDNLKIFIDRYRSSDGTEFFISIENESRNMLYGFLRLRLNDNWESTLFPALKNASFIRELHIYGKTIKQSTMQKILHNKNIMQHNGLGKLLIYIAEYITFINNHNRISIISGVGVRQYYKKFGYQNQDTYMIKDIMIPDKSLIKETYETLVEKAMIDYKKLIII